MEKIWQVLESAPESFFLEHPELPPPVANLLYHRNIRMQEEIDEFLNPDYSEDIHDPYLFKDMKKAVKRILKAIEKQEKIVIHGDYDADGVSASVILVSTIKALGGKNVECFLPHREIDGYGLNTNTIQKLAEEKTNLIITCDCGVGNYKEVKLANKNNIDVIITDHHAVPEKLPPAHAIIHPQVKNEKYPDKGLAGGAVAFKLMQGLLRKHKENNELLLNGETHEAFEKWLLDMVAIASVADMVPLVGESRTLTKYGLVVLNKTQRIGLQKLLLEARLTGEEGKVKKEINTTTIGFQIAPRINAAGRMNHANVAYNLMMTEDPEEATQLARELDENNQERQKMTEELVKRSILQIEDNQIDKPVLFVLGENWSPGIVGLIAGRIKERYYKPTIVMAQNEGEIMGSGRSIDGFNLIESLQEMPELFEKFGGHPMACGFSLKSLDKLDEFKKSLIKKFIEKTKDIDIRPTLLIDAEVNIDNVDWEMHDVLKKFEPFGQANEKPKYLAKNLTIQNLEPVGKEGKHLRIMVKNGTDKIRKTIGWSLCNGSGTNWCEELKVGDKIDIVFEVDVNEWNGNRELQLTIVDLRKTCDTNNDTDDADIYADDADYADFEESVTGVQSKLIYEDLTYKINGILFSVQNKLGRYCNEKQVCDAIEDVLKKEKIVYEREKVLPPSFEGEHAGRNRIDFLIENKIILEIKTIRFTGKEEYYQCLRYLEALNKKLCLLVNFRDKYLKIKRIINPKAKI